MCLEATVEPPQWKVFRTRWDIGPLNLIWPCGQWALTSLEHMLPSSALPSLELLKILGGTK